MKNNDGGPAFPQGVYVLEEGVFVLAGSEPGLSKLDYFAAEAMKGLLAGSGEIFRNDLHEVLAGDTVHIAEVMIEELERRNAGKG